MLKLYMLCHRHFLVCLTAGRMPITVDMSTSISDDLDEKAVNLQIAFLFRVLRGHAILDTAWQDLYWNSFLVRC